MRAVLIVFSILSASSALTQVDSLNSQTADTISFIDPQQPPSFPGGEMAMVRFIEKALIYPDICAQGRVYVEFTVEEDGSITDMSIKRGVSELLDAEALRLIGAFPKWNPAKQNGIAVRTRWTLPVYFRR